VAKQLKGVVNVAAINAVEHRTEIAVTSVPQVKLFIDGNKIDYSGSKSTKSIVKFVREQLKLKKGI